MIRCEEFYEKVKWDGNFCGMGEDTMEEENCQVDKTIMVKLRCMEEFKENQTAVLPLPNYAVEPLRTESDMEVQAEVISQIENSRPQERERFTALY